LLTPLFFSSSILTNQRLSDVGVAGFLPDFLDPNAPISRKLQYYEQSKGWGEEKEEGRRGRGNTRPHGHMLSRRVAAFRSCISQPLRSSVGSNHGVKYITVGGKAGKGKRHSFDGPLRATQSVPAHSVMGTRRPFPRGYSVSVDESFGIQLTMIFLERLPCKDWARGPWATTS
jgi:hypothetical protein